MELNFGKTSFHQDIDYFIKDLIELRDQAFKYLGEDHSRQKENIQNP